MSNYTKTTDFAAKDALATGNANKVVSGTELDAEFDNIASAITTKFDTTNLATQAQATGLSLDTVLITPHSLNDVLVANAGALADIQAFTDPLTDRVFGWDASAGNAIGFTLGTGLVFSDTEIVLSILGLEDLTDPAADRVLFWDDSAGALAWLTSGSGLVVSGTTLTVDHDAATNFVADEHIPHSSINLSAGNGLTGGGTIAADRTFAVGAGLGITVNANDVAINMTIAADPGGTPAGSPGELFLYY